jgi:6-phosphogluconolactonase (cycloisomerase 2 family)
MFMRPVIALALGLCLLASSARASYTAAATVWEALYAQVIGLDAEGNIAVQETLAAGGGYGTDLEPTSDGRLLVIDGATTPYGTVYSVRPSAVFNKTQELGRLYYFAVSSNNRYVVSYLPTGDMYNELLVYEIQGDHLQYKESAPRWGKSTHLVQYSKYSGRFVTNNLTDKTLDIYLLTPDGHLMAEGSAISYEDYSDGSSFAISPDGRTCVMLGGWAHEIAVFRIHEDGEINYLETVNSPEGWNVSGAAFTPDSRIAIFIFVGAGGSEYVQSYRIESNGRLTKVDALGNMQLAQSISITPDGNFALVSHHYYSNGEQTLSAIRIHHDATLTWLSDKDLVMMGHFFYSCFIPPQVLGAYGVVPEGTERPVYMETFADWQEGSVPGVFDVPESWVMPDGSLALRPTSTTNCFGFWQSPVDALMVVPYSVYRARFAVRASNAGSSEGPELVIPTLRLRTNAQTLQQADTLVLNSTPGGFLKTTEVPSTFTLFFELPISSCSREEEMDDVFCSLDLMAFNGEADIGTTYVLSRVLVDRLPVECFDVEEVVRDYEFSDDAEGWTYGGAPGVFAMPQCSHVPGALLISAAGKTNCFGFWNSDPADAVTTSGEAIYRATFYVRTNQPDRWRVPTFRLRLGTSRSELITTHEIISANDSEMSPYYDSTDPAYQFEYPVYLYKPETAEPLNLLLAFDLLNFDETDDANTLLILDRVRLERLALPQFPLDD